MQDLCCFQQIIINKFITFMDMAPRSLKTLFTIFEKTVKASPVRFYCLLHDMSFLIPLHAIEKKQDAIKR